MEFKANITSSDTHLVTIDDECPNCKKPTNPHLVNSSYYSLDETDTSLVLTFRCLGCKHYWVEEFIAERYSTGPYSSDYEYAIEPIEVEPILLSDIPIYVTVLKISLRAVFSKISISSLQIYPACVNTQHITNSIFEFITAFAIL